MVTVVFFLTAAVLTLVQARMRRHIYEDMVSTLRAESAATSQIQEARRAQSQQNATLVANQPILKALMSTNDRLTVEDGSESLLQTSQADLMVLENANGEMLAFHSRSDDVPVSTVKRMLAESMLSESISSGAMLSDAFLSESGGEQDWWFAGGHLYQVSFAPIVAGAGDNQRFLGTVALGRELSNQSIAATNAENTSFVIERGGSLILTSLPSRSARDFESSIGTGIGIGISKVRESSVAGAIREINISGERYLTSVVELPGDHPVRLYSLQSFDQATAFLRALNRMLLTVGAIAVLVGALIAFVLSKQITRPLELLAAGTRRLEQGDFEFKIPVSGSDEVAELSRAFDEMRNSLRQSREGLVRSARLEAVGQLAGGVAHDFNNLVMIIKGYSELLLDSASAEAKPYLEEIKNAGDRASGLTRQLLAFSRKQVLEPQVLDPNQTVRNMVKMLRVLIGEDIELATNLAEKIGRIKADPGQVEQVIMNLAVNARDAMPGGGKLIVETQPCELDEGYAATHAEVTAGPYVQIAMTDTGCGMGKETLEHIFEPFFTTKGPGKGTGLGLATVYGIVKQSRGHITVYSEPGVGTTFKVYFPSLDTSVPLAQTRAAAAALKGEGTILLVEDEAPLRVLAAESLKRLGYNVLQAGNGLEALAVADHHAGIIDVVVTDIVMPRMGGPELVEKLRQKRERVAVIFMSGYTETAALENSNIGVDAVLLNKPFSTEALARKIAWARRGGTGEQSRGASAGSTA
jgi:signal transduction histidine kinase/ActR/RegA family two-component response regulator